jgi:hypothetical protein
LLLLLLLGRLQSLVVLLLLLGRLQSLPLLLPRR